MTEIKNINTNWNSPKTNILAATLDLRKALIAGCNARLIRMRNEDCEHPIRVKHHDTDFRNYEFHVGYVRTRSDIIRDQSMSDFEKYLALNYKTCYGTHEAMQRYYTTGKLSADNLKGMGRPHLVKVEDLIMFYVLINNKDLAEQYRRQYIDDDNINDSHWWDFYRYKYGSQFAPKIFKRKLWVVELLSKDKPKSIPVAVKILNIVLYPLKYIPRRSVLRMDKYTNYTFRIGGVTNGLAIEFQIPKKFSFN